MRLGTSPSNAPSATHTASSSFSLNRFAGTTVLLYAVLCNKADGDDRMDALLETIKGNKPALQHVEFATRQSAHAILRNELDEAVRVRNPLPPAVRDALDPGSAKGAEQRARLSYIERHMQTIEQEHPGRVMSPRENNRTLRDVLEEQFGMSIISDNAVIERQLRIYDGGKDGQTSMKALMELCRNLRCAPEILNNVIILKPIKPGDYVRANDTLCHVVHEADDNWSSTVFRAPDKGVILSVGTWGPSESVSALNNTIIPLWKVLGRQENGQFRIFHFGPHEAVIAEHPEIRSLMAKDDMTVTLQGQEIRVGSIEQQKNGWKTTLYGEIDRKYFWSAADPGTYCFANDLIGKNHVTVRGEENRKVAVKHESIVVNGDHYTWQIWTEEHPATFDIRVFTRIFEESLKLP